VFETFKYAQLSCPKFKKLGQNNVLSKLEGSFLLENVLRL